LGRSATDIPVQEWTGHYGCFLPDGVTPFPADQLPLVRAIRGEPADVEMLIRNPKMGEAVWIEATGRPLKNESGGMQGGVVAFRDVTKTKAAEREIRKLNDELEERVIQRTAQLEEVNKELEAFTYSVSHDLRAPLRHMAGFSGLLLEEFGPTLDSQGQHYVQRIQEGTRKMGQLVDELLGLARVGRQALSLQLTGLNPIVEEVVAMLKPEYDGREVEWKIANLPFVECDPTLIKQVFQNLLSNALKYSRPRPQAMIEVAATQSNGQPVIFVRDNGVGFNMKYSDKLFGVFQRLHRSEDFEGTGVGLATVQRIIKKHSGRVWAEAELEKGATFYFTVGGSKPASVNHQSAVGGTAS
jgi:light-regulated signal transduction histidine kinase (bacteriophytochrome)